MDPLGMPGEMMCPISIVHGMMESITPSRWTRQVLNDWSGPEWRGCILGHLSFVVSGSYDLDETKLDIVVAHNRNIQEVVEAIALVCLERYYGRDRPPMGEAWNFITQLSLIAIVNDTCDSALAIRQILETVMQRMAPVPPKLSYTIDEHEQLETIRKTTLLPHFIDEVKDNGEYAPLSPSPSVEEKIDLISEVDLDAEFAELLSKEPVAA